MTAKQLALLRYICGYQEANGRTPSFDEMRAATGCKSKSSIHNLMQGLIERGHIERPRAYFSRRLDVIDVVPVPHAPDGAPLFVVPL